MAHDVTSTDVWAAGYLGVHDRIPGGRSHAERQARYRARKKGIIAPFPFLAADLYANAIEVMVREDMGACLVWTRRQTTKGYGQLKRDGRSVYAHRASLELKLGRPLAPGMVARHRCDNPPCIRQAHLVEGTAADNRADMAARGRGWWQRSEQPVRQPDDDDDENDEH